MKKKYLIIGLGITGLSCVRYLVAQDHSVMVTDTREHPPGLSELQSEYPDVPVSFGAINTDFIAQADTLVVSPGVPLATQEIVAASDKEIIGDIELFARAAEKPIIAITGSNGKSTVTTMVGEMIAAAGKIAGIGGNIGKPALELLNEPADYYVLELSSFQLETTHSLNAEVAVLLNASPDHLDRYASYADYIAAKQVIYQGCQIAIINADQSEIYTDITAPNVIEFGVKAPARFHLIDQKLLDGDRVLLHTDELCVHGQHQAANVLAALAIGSAINLPVDAMKAALKVFSGLSHRCQWVRSLNNVDWYNDSKGTNVGATCAAVAGLGDHVTGKLILIAGGRGKDADFSPLQQPVQQFVKQVICLGESKAEIAGLLADYSDVCQVTSLEKAVDQAYAIAQPGDAVLLSPACASFDMFSDYQERGQVFINAVEQL